MALGIEAALLLLISVAPQRALGREIHVPPSGARFICTPISVWDGDGPIWCQEGPRIRLAGINARELDGSCRPRARCVSTSGVTARDRLAAMLGDVRGKSRDGHLRLSAASIACVSRGPDRYRRTLASCSAGGRDIGTELIRNGTVAPY